jgi:hypothetical protein
MSGRTATRSGLRVALWCGTRGPAIAKARPLALYRWSSPFPPGQSKHRCRLRSPRNRWQRQRTRHEMQARAKARQSELVVDSLQNLKKTDAPDRAPALERDTGGREIRTLFEILSSRNANLHRSRQVRCHDTYCGMLRAARDGKREFSLTFRTATRSFPAPPRHPWSQTRPS